MFDCYVYIQICYFCSQGVNQVTDPLQTHTKACSDLDAELKIKWGLEIIFLFLNKKTFVVTPHENHLFKTVLMRDNSIGFSRRYRENDLRNNFSLPVNYR